MLKQHARTVDLLLRVGDLVLLTLALPLAHLLYDRAPLARAEPPTLDGLWLAMVGVLIVWIAASGSSQVYDVYRTRSLATELWRIARALGTVALILVSVLFLSKDTETPRLFVVMFFMTAFANMSASRLITRTVARSMRRKGYNVRRYAIVGTGSAADEVIKTFSSNPQWGFQLAGLILPTGKPIPAPANPVLGTLEDLERILDEHVLDEIVFAVPRDHLASIDGAIKLCEEQGVAVVVSLQTLNLGQGRKSLFELSDLSMLVFTRTPSDVVGLAMKRTFDIAVSATALLVLAPLFLAVAAAIRIESPGPVFFKQKRVGRNGRTFTMMKFRSMFQDAEQRLEALKALNEMTGPVFKMKNDPRITRVGRFIRRTSIDELPQFINVLLGEMSVVGPRPPIPAEVRQYKRWQRRRLSVKPGITCTWQVSGRNGIDFDQWMALDLEYIDNWSLWRDVQIFFKTIPAVLSARGAH